MFDAVTPVGEMVGRKLSKKATKALAPQLQKIIEGYQIQLNRLLASHPVRHFVKHTSELFASQPPWLSETVTAKFTIDPDKWELTLEFTCPSKKLLTVFGYPRGVEVEGRKQEPGFALTNLRIFQMASADLTPLGHLFWASLIHHRFGQTHSPHAEFVLAASELLFEPQHANYFLDCGFHCFGINANNHDLLKQSEWLPHQGLIAQWRASLGEATLRPDTKVPLFGPTPSDSFAALDLTDLAARPAILARLQHSFSERTGRTLPGSQF